MDQGSDPSESDVPVISNRGILIMMAVVVVLGAIAGFIFGGPRFGTGVIFGGLLAFVNYWWLNSSTKAMLVDNAMASTSILALKYILRYAVLMGLLLIVFWTDALPVIAVILGLGAFAFAVVIQGLRNIFTSSF